MYQHSRVCMEKGKCSELVDSGVLLTACMCIHTYTYIGRYHHERAGAVPTMEFDVQPALCIAWNFAPENTPRKAPPGRGWAWY